MKVLVACEFSGIVRNAFAAKGGQCCNNHDLCYYGYLNNGNPYIINNTFDSQNCEKNFIHNYYFIYSFCNI